MPLLENYDISPGRFSRNYQSYQFAAKNIFKKVLTNVINYGIIRT